MENIICADQELFVWPWTVVIVNIPVDDTEFKDLLTILGFNQERVKPLCNNTALVEFGKYWSEFNKAMSFEKFYESNNRSKKHWHAKNDQNSGLYAWIARVDDYISTNIIGESLRKNGDLRTMLDIMEEEDRKSSRLVGNLVKVIEEKNKDLLETKNKLKETESCTISNEELDSSQEISNMFGNLKLQLEKSEERIARCNGIIDYLGKINKTLKLEIKHLRKKNGELDDLEALNQTLIVKELKSSVELQDARRELIKGWKIRIDQNTTLGIKLLGKLDFKPFTEAMKMKYPCDIVDALASKLYIQWEEYLEDPLWHPFKVVKVNGKPQEVIDVGDERLKMAKEEYGDEVYNALAKALVELNEYNPSGRRAFQEMWNYSEDRKATLKEGVASVLKDTYRLSNRRR